MDTNPTSQNGSSKAIDEVDSTLQEYQPLLPSEPVVTKAQRKPSTFVVTPVSLINNNLPAIQPQQVLARYNLKNISTIVILPF